MAAAKSISVASPGFGMRETRPVKILIVDNDKDILMALERALEDEGYAAETAISYAEAYRLLLRDVFDILVLDDYLSDKDSVEAPAELRRVQAVPPVVVVTYHHSPSRTDRARFSLMGAGEFVNKSSTYDLIDTVRRMTAY